MQGYPASRDLLYCHEERDERETSANSHSVFLSHRCPKIWMYQSGLKLVWRLCSHATTATAVFLWDHELVAMRQYYPLTYFRIYNPAWIGNMWQVLQWFCKICFMVWSKLSNCKIKELLEWLFTEASLSSCSLWQYEISARRVMQGSNGPRKSLKILEFDFRFSRTWKPSEFRIWSLKVFEISL